MNLDIIEELGTKIAIQNFLFYKDWYLKLFADAYLKHKKKDDPYELYGIYSESNGGLRTMEYFNVFMGYVWRCDNKAKPDFWPIFSEMRLAPEYAQHKDQLLVFDIDAIKIDFYRTKYVEAIHGLLIPYGNNEKYYFQKSFINLFDRQFHNMVDFKDFIYFIYPGMEKEYQTYLEQLHNDTERRIDYDFR